MTNLLDGRLAEKIRAALRENNPALAVKKMKKCLEKAKNTPLNIGITGESGSGKSSFVNALRGIGDTDMHSASVGCVETTTQVTKYPHPSYTNVTLWDLPGIGTTRFPTSRYLRHVGFEKFDFFIIISDTRFRENDVTLAKEIQRLGKKFYFVRSKVDNDLRSVRKSKRGVSESQTLTLIRTKCIEGLQQEGLRCPRVFLVSRFDIRLYDFPLIHQTLKRDLPDHERDVLRHAMHNISLEVIQEKKDSFEERITTQACMSAGGAILPIPGLSIALDLTLLVTVALQYTQGFGLDEPSLKSLSQSSGVPLSDLKDAITSPLALKTVTPDLLVKILLQCSSTAALLVAQKGFMLIPLIGGLVAAPLSYKVTKNALEMFLHSLAEDAENVFRTAIDAIF